MLAARRLQMRQRLPPGTERVTRRQTIAARTVLLVALGLGLPRFGPLAAPVQRVAAHGSAGPQRQSAPPHAPAAPQGPVATGGTARAPLRGLSPTRGSASHFTASAPPAVAVAGLRGQVKPQVSGQVGGPAFYDARRGARLDGGLVAPRR